MFLTYLLTLTVAFLTSYLALYKIISIAHLKHLFDHPSEERKIHKHKTPNLGGAALFFSIAFTVSLFPAILDIPYLNYVTSAILLLFLIGLTDDLVGMAPLKKLWGQLIVTLIITIFTNYRIESLYGIFGIHEIPAIMGMLLTVLFILSVINAFNLIDGVNCLASGIAFVSFAAFSFLFWKLNQPGFLLLNLTLCGTLLAFFLYNKTPAKIFLGDSGSLVIGLILSIVSLHYLSITDVSNASVSQDQSKAPAIIFSLIVIPIFDTLRVFTLRILQRKSPFYADRNHIHHLLLDLNFSHLQTSAILVSFTVVMLLISSMVKSVNIEGYITGSMIFLAIVCRLMTMVIKRQKENAHNIKLPAGTQVNPELRLRILKDSLYKNFTEYENSEPRVNS